MRDTGEPARRNLIGLRRTLRWILAAGLAFAATGCGQTQPYIYKADEFNRESKTFAERPQTISVLELCYSSLFSTPEEVRAMAREECGKYGKVAEFRYQEHGVCPLLTPTHAIFACLQK